MSNGGFKCPSPKRGLKCLTNGLPSEAVTFGVWKDKEGNLNRNEVQKPKRAETMGKRASVLRLEPIKERSQRLRSNNRSNLGVFCLILSKPFDRPFLP